MNKKPIIIITMAGKGERFTKAGYDVPKYEIETKGKTLFEWSLMSLSDFYDCEFVFICRDCNESFITSICDKLGITIRKIINIGYVTSGQAETVTLAFKENVIDPIEPILIYNIDTYVEPNTIKKKDVINGDGTIVCFNGDGDKWSFALTEENTNNVILVKEKERISNKCSIGAYYFSTYLKYNMAYTNYYSNKNNIEKYIAPIYNDMILLGYDIYAPMIDSSKVHVLGTPEDLKIFELNYEYCGS